MIPKLIFFKICPPIIIFISILVGLLYIGPPLVVQKKFNDSDHEFVLAQYKTYRDSLHAYLPRAREIYDGHFPPGELYGSEQKPTIQNLLPSALFALFIFLFKGNMGAAYLGAQFLFSGVIFLLFYLLGHVMFKSKIWSIFFSLVATLTPIALKLPFYKWRGIAEFQAFFINNFFPLTRTQFDQLYLARIDEPLLTYPFYLSAILVFFIFWKKPSFISAALSGILSGLLFYTYFHHWVYWISVLLILFLYVVWFRKEDKNKFKLYLILFSFLAVTVIPYFWQYFSFNKLATADDFILRSGVAFGRDIGIVRTNLADYAVYFLLALSVFFLYRKNNRNKCVLMLGLIAGMFFVWNVQLFVGYVPVPHFFRRSISPIIFLIVFNIFYDLFIKLEIRFEKLKRISAVILLTLSLFVVSKKITNIFFINYGIQQHIADYYKFPDNVVYSWNWINSNLQHENRVVSDSTMTSFYINTYTSLKPFLPTAFITLLSTKDIENRYLMSHKVFGVSGSILKQRLEGKFQLNCVSYKCPPDKGSNLNDSFGNLYGNYFPSSYGTFGSFVSNSKKDFISKKKDEKIEELVDIYGKIDMKWDDIDADYVYAGPLENDISSINFMLDKKLKIVYKDPQVSIYKILK